ncbi:MAG: ribosome maturation factor RimM [Oscillospiraceae bacterium]
MEEYIEAGEFVTTFGILGEIKIYPYCDSADMICGFKTLYLDKKGAKPLQVESAREHKGMCLAKLEGISNPEDARKYVGKTVYFARKDAKLPKGRYFVQDIIGSVVQDANTNKIYGKVTDIARPAAQDIYTIKSENGAEYLFPAVAEFLKEIDIDKKLVLVTPIKGMLEDNGANDDED